MANESVTTSDAAPRTEVVPEALSRRDLVATLLGAGGVAALAGCNQSIDPSTGESERVDVVAQALSGATSIRWCDTMTEQQAVKGGTAGTSVNVCIRRGYATPADGGGGVWIWTTDTTTAQSTDPAGSLLVVPTGTRTGCWKRVYSGPLDVKWFGAIGDVTGASHPLSERFATLAAAQVVYPHALALTDEIDWASIQAALNALRASGGTVCIPAGTYSINQSIRMYSSTGLRGMSATVDPTYGSAIRWRGPGDHVGTMIRAWGANISVANLRFTIVGGYSANRAIDATFSDTGDMCTAHEYENVFIQGAGGNLTYGIVIGDKSQGLPSYPYNCDYFTLRRIQISDIGHSCVNVPNTTAQSKAMRLEHCAFLRAQYGIWAASGDFQCSTLGLNSLTASALHWEHATGPLSFLGCDLEACSRLYEDAGAIGTSVPLSFGGRFDCTSVGGLAMDGRYISMGHQGPLSLEGCTFVLNGGTNWRVFNPSGNALHRINARGTVFPNVAGGPTNLFMRWGSPTDIPDVTSPIVLSGCTACESDGSSPTFLPDTTEMGLTTAQRDALANVREGQAIYNLSVHKTQTWDGTAWRDHW